MSKTNKGFFSKKLINFTVKDGIKLYFAIYLYKIFSQVFNKLTAPSLQEMKDALDEKLAEKKKNNV